MDGFDLLASEIPPDPRRRWGLLGQAQRDAAYDNNAAVTDSPALIEARNTASAALRTSRPEALDLPYAEGQRTCWDLYPAGDRAAPCLVFIHGGYWQRNSRELFAMMAESLSAWGWSVAIPGYCLAPEATLSQIVSEVHTAMDWLAREGASHGIAGPVIVSGWSAGAQLAALVLSHPRISAGLAISGIYDLAPIRDTGLNRALKLTDDEVQRLSPLRLAPVPKPLVIAYGSAELPALIWDSRRFHEMRAAAHMPGALVPVAKANHFTILDHLRRKDGELTGIVRSLAERLPA
jgi:arylformamidase